MIQVSGNPLDFSFLKLTDIESIIHYKLQICLGLRKEEPRAGKRKPVRESDDEEDKKVFLNLLIYFYRTTILLIKSKNKYLQSKFKPKMQNLM